MNKTNREFETKVLDINPEEVIQKLRQLGADETPETLSKRFMCDLESVDIEVIRLRTNGKKTTLTYKHKIRGNTKIGETIEIEVEVADFDKTAALLSKIPFKFILYQENKSHIFRLDEIEFSIDTWPLLPSYLEIESFNQKKVAYGLKLLGMEGKDIGDKDIRVIALEHGFDINTYSYFGFDRQEKL